MLNHVCCYVVYMLAIYVLKFNRHLKCLYIRNTRMCFMTDLCALCEWSYSSAEMCQQQSLPMMQNKSGVGHHIALPLNQLLSGVSVKCNKVKPNGVFQFLDFLKVFIYIKQQKLSQMEMYKKQLPELRRPFFTLLNFGAYPYGHIAQLKHCSKHVKASRPSGFPGTG